MTAVSDLGRGPIPATTTSSSSHSSPAAFVFPIVLRVPLRKVDALLDHQHQRVGNVAGDVRAEEDEPRVLGAVGVPERHVRVVVFAGRDVVHLLVRAQVAAVPLAVGGRRHERVVKVGVHLDHVRLPRGHHLFVFFLTERASEKRQRTV